jgi:hypothetical protein
MGPGFKNAVSEVRCPDIFFRRFPQSMQDSDAPSSQIPVIANLCKDCR